MSRNLIATVGSNPLPVVIVAKHLKPPKLWLLYTKSTAKVHDGIKELLSQKLERSEILSVEMAEGCSHREATDELASKAVDWAGANLNYTAGTKQMSVVVHELWRKMNPEQSEGPDACYLNSDGILYWDTGRKREHSIFHARGRPVSAWFARLGNLPMIDWPENLLHELVPTSAQKLGS